MSAVIERRTRPRGIASRRLAKGRRCIEGRLPRRACALVRRKAEYSREKLISAGMVLLHLERNVSSIAVWMARTLDEGAATSRLADASRNATAASEPEGESGWAPTRDNPIAGRLRSTNICL